MNTTINGTDTAPFCAPFRYPQRSEDFPYVLCYVSFFVNVCFDVLSLFSALYALLLYRQRRTMRELWVFQTIIVLIACLRLGLMRPLYGVSTPDLATYSAPLEDRSLILLVGSAAEGMMWTLLGASVVSYTIYWSKSIHKLKYGSCRSRGNALKAPLLVAFRNVLFLLGIVTGVKIMTRHNEWDMASWWRVVLAVLILPTIIMLMYLSRAPCRLAREATAKRGSLSLLEPRQSDRRQCLRLMIVAHHVGGALSFLDREAESDSDNELDRYNAVDQQLDESALQQAEWLGNRILVSSLGMLSAFVVLAVQSLLEKRHVYDRHSIVTLSVVYEFTSGVVVLLGSLSLQHAQF